MTADAIHFYNWETCKTLCQTDGGDDVGGEMETENTSRVTCPECRARLGLDKLLHAEAPDGTSECDAPGFTTDDIDRVNCPKCEELLAPWLDGTAEVAAPANEALPAPIETPAPVQVDDEGREREVPAVAIQTDAAGKIFYLTPEQVLWLAQTIAWNVDLETVRIDNGDVERGDFLAVFADRILGEPRD